MRDSSINNRLKHDSSVATLVNRQFPMGVPNKTTVKIPFKYDQRHVEGSTTQAKRSCTGRCSGARKRDFDEESKRDQQSSYIKTPIINMEHRFYLARN